MASCAKVINLNNLEFFIEEQPRKTSNSSNSTNDTKDKISPRDCSDTFVE